jgi:hypothetical protein
MSLERKAEAEFLNEGLIETVFAQALIERLMEIPSGNEHASNFLPGLLGQGRWRCTRRNAPLSFLLWDELLRVNNLTFYWLCGEPCCGRKRLSHGGGALRTRTPPAQRGWELAKIHHFVMSWVRSRPSPNARRTSLLLDENEW